MSRVRECDLCENTFNRTYSTSSNGRCAKDGRGSSQIKPSLRRRIFYKLFGRFAFRVYDRGDRTAWKTLDLCSSCTQSVKGEVKRRVNNEQE